MSYYPSSPRHSYSTPAPQTAQTAGGAMSPGGIQVGSITYTTTTGPDGRTIYQPFRAEAASYQTPNGVIHGIQWVPAEATQIIPHGAQPAPADFSTTANWKRDYASPEQSALKDWEYEEERRRRKEEKESAKKLAQWDRDRREREKAEEQMEREMRRQDRRASGTPYPSYDQGATGLEGSMGNMNMGGGYPAAGAGYGPGGRTRKISFNDERGRTASGNYGTAPYGGAQTSPYGAAGTTAPYGGGYPTPPSSYSSDPYAPAGSPPVPGGYPSSRAGSDVGGYSVHSAGSMYRSSSPRPSPVGADGIYRSSSPRPMGDSLYRSSSPRPLAEGGIYRSSSPRPMHNDPYGRPASPRPGAPAGMYGASSTGVYPRGHVLEGQALPPNMPPPVMGPPRSRAGSPAIGGYGTLPQTGIYPPPSGVPPIGIGRPGYSPRMGSAPMPEPSIHGAPLGGLPASQLSSPDGFLRPVNAAQPYTPFQRLKITDMDELFTEVPRMPQVLVPHDVYHHDWIRLMEDLTMAWNGSLPMPTAYSSGPPRKSSLAADMVQQWNTNFFLRRGVELTLYKGRDCRTGPGAGRKSARLAREDLDESSDEDSSESSLSDSDDERRPAAYGSHYGAGAGRGGVYGEHGQWGADAESARRERRQRKKDKKRRERERKRRDKSKKYTLWITSVPMASPSRPY